MQACKENAVVQCIERGEVRVDTQRSSALPGYIIVQVKTICHYSHQKVYDQEHTDILKPEFPK